MKNVIVTIAALSCVVTFFGAAIMAAVKEPTTMWLVGFAVSAGIGLIAEAV